MPAPKNSSVAARSIQRYWNVTMQRWPLFALAVLSTMMFAFCLSFFNPFLVGKIVDRLTADPVGLGEVFKVFGVYIAMLIGSNVLGQVGSKLQDYSVWKLQLHANYVLATQAFDTLSNQSMTFHSNRFGGSLVSQTSKFIGAYSTLIECLVYAIIPIICSVTFTVLMLSRAVPFYVAMLLVLIVFYTVSVYVMYKKILPFNSAAARAQSALSGELSDSISNILSVKTYGRESYEREIFDSTNIDAREADAKRMYASTKRGVVSSSIIVVIMAVVAIFATGGNAWFGISAGTLVMMFTYTNSLTMQLNRIANTLAQVNRGLGDAHEMTVILDEPTLVADDPDAQDIVACKGDISFENLDFAYADDDQTLVFDNLTLHIPAGQRVGLIGRSGSGKTTLTTLLLRLSNLQGGRILIDGQDVSRVTQVSLRQHIAYVPQEPLLFHRTIRENIAYGKPDASEEEIRLAAQRANALEFIEALPNGFDTQTGERGVKLSGGQRQRIAIARAILVNAPILVLDEATSALDSESEKLIQDALANLMRNRTAIVVAHRLSTVASLDRIIVLREGRIVEDGSHEQLVAQDGEYARLWNRQTGAFLAEDCE